MNPRLPVLALGFATALAGAGCVSLPPIAADRPVSTAIADGASTHLGRRIAGELANHPGQSGLHALLLGEDAFLARLALMQAAERTLDLQYYIWHNDATGRILFESLMRAADRGVRVRVLLDDVGTAAKDYTLLVVDAHPNVEVRLFNPIALRSQRGLGSLFELGRINRRMHNKSFTADNQATIVGGRNIGDEYFSARPDVNFGDLDVLAIGPVVNQISSAFDLYWNGPHAYRISKLAQDDAATAERLAAARAVLEGELDSSRHKTYVEALQAPPAQQTLLEEKYLKFHWGRAVALYDSPDKVSTKVQDSTSGVATGLSEAFAHAREELIIVSPYFVPGKSGVPAFAHWRERGVRVKVLTNSLAATDVGASHAGYAHHREDLLKLGVELYELKPNPAPRPSRAELKAASGVPGSSRASLHAKTFVFDRQRVFVGSLNFTPRSVQLNTEIGILFENEAMARELAGELDMMMQEDSYRLKREGNDLRWVTVEDGVERTFTGEPGVGVFTRLCIFLLSLLPIEGQL